MFWWKRRRHPRVQISRAVWGLCKAAHGFQRKPKTARTAPVTSHRFETRKKETVICGEQERDILATVADDAPGAALRIIRFLERLSGVCQEAINLRWNILFVEAPIHPNPIAL